MALNNFVKSIRNIMRNDAGINGDAQRIEQIAWMLFLKVYDEKENDWEFNEDDYKSFIPENCRWRNWAPFRTIAESQFDHRSKYYPLYDCCYSCSRW